MVLKKCRCYRESTGKRIALFKVQAPKKILMKLNLQIVVSASATPVLAQDIFASRPLRSQMRLASRWFSKRYCETYYPSGNSQDIRRIETSYDN
jgi:hypothetical protein